MRKRPSGTAKGVCCHCSMALWRQGASGMALGARRGRWGRRRGIAEVARFVGSLADSKHRAVERGDREADRCPRMVEMSLQILSPNREAGDLLGQSTGPSEAAGWAFPPSPQSFLSRPARGQKARGSHPSCSKASQICSRLSQMGSAQGARLGASWVPWLTTTLRVSHPSLAVI